MLDMLKSVFEFFVHFFEKFPHLLTDKRFWFVLSGFACISGLLAYFFA